MSLSPSQKTQELIKDCQAPLIFLPPYPKIDALASAFALARYFEERKVAAKIICETGDKLKESLQFINPAPAVETALTEARDFLIAFNTKYNPISHVRTEKQRDELRIYITPEKAAIDPRDFSFQPSHFHYDVAIVIGAPDKEHLGTVYESNPDVFYEIPIVNIDNASANEEFGQVNLVDITASSLSEILYELLKDLDAEPLSAINQEYLLAGIISGTQSFQKKNTSPKALKAASELMEAGADQQKIVKNLFKTQPLHILKLWGKVMANIKWDEERRLIWGTIGIEDFVASRAHIKDLPEVLDKLRANYSDAKLYALIYQEKPDCTCIIFYAQDPEVLETLQKVFPEARFQGELLFATLEHTSLGKAEEKFLALLIKR